MDPGIVDIEIFVHSVSISQTQTSYPSCVSLVNQLYLIQGDRTGLPVDLLDVGVDHLPTDSGNHPIVGPRIIGGIPIIAAAAGRRR